MKKLFENKGGNQFRLLTEDIGGENLVASGLEKVFGAGDSKIPFDRVEAVGLGYIKDVTTAQKTAMKIADELAKKYGYVADESVEAFFKTMQEEHDESDMSNSEEKREVEIGKEIYNLADAIVLHGPDDNHPYFKHKLRIKELAKELIDMHNKEKKAYGGSPIFKGGGHGGL